MKIKIVITKYSEIFNWLLWRSSNEDIEKYVWQSA